MIQEHHQNFENEYFPMLNATVRRKPKWLALRLVAATMTTVAAVAFVINLYIHCRPFSVGTTNAILDVRVHNNYNENEIQYVIVPAASNPDINEDNFRSVTGIVGRGTLESDRSGIYAQNLSPGTRYSVVFFTEVEGEDKFLKVYDFTTGVPEPDKNPTPGPVISGSSSMPASSSEEESSEPYSSSEEDIIVPIIPPYSSSSSEAQPSSSSSESSSSQSQSSSSSSSSSSSESSSEQPSYSASMTLENLYEDDPGDYADDFVTAYLIPTITLSGVQTADGTVTAPTGIDIENIKYTVTSPSIGTVVDGETVRGMWQNVSGDTAEIYIEETPFTYGAPGEELTVTAVVPYDGGEFDVSATITLPERTEDLVMTIEVEDTGDSDMGTDDDGKIVVYPNLDAYLTITGDLVDIDGEHIIYPESIDTENILIRVVKEDYTTVASDTVSGLLTAENGEINIYVEYVPMEAVYPGEVLTIWAEVTHADGTLEAYTEYTVPELPELGMTLEVIEMPGPDGVQIYYPVYDEDAGDTYGQPHLYGKLTITGLTTADPDAGTVDEVNIEYITVNVSGSKGTLTEGYVTAGEVDSIDGDTAVIMIDLQEAIQTAWSEETLTVTASTESMYGDLEATGSWTMPEIKAEYLVEFDSEHGTVPMSQRVERGDYATRPDPITADGYTFEYWYDPSLTVEVEFDFENTPITGDLTLVARWSVAKHTVTFVTDHGTAPDAQLIDHGSTATDPGSLTADGYTFNGWLDESGATFDFGTEITGDITLTASWTVVQHTVTFVTDHGTAPDAQMVDHNGYATDPGTLTADGYTFEFWFNVDEPAAFAFDFENTQITGDLTLRAQWTENKNYSMTLEITGDEVYDEEYDENKQDMFGYPDLAGTLTITGVTGQGTEITDPEGLELSEISMTITGSKGTETTATVSGTVTSVTDGTAQIELDWTGIDGAWSEEELTFEATVEYEGGTLTATGTWTMPKLNNYGMTLEVFYNTPSWVYPSDGGAPQANMDVYGTLLLSGIELDGENVVDPTGLDAENVGITVIREDGSELTATAWGQPSVNDNGQYQIILISIPVNEPLEQNERITIVATVTYDGGELTAEAEIVVPEKPDDDLDLTMELTPDYSKIIVIEGGWMRPYLTATMTIGGDSVIIGADSLTYPEQVDLENISFTVTDQNGEVLTDGLTAAGTLDISSGEPVITVEQVPFDHLVDPERPTVTVTATVSYLGGELITSADYTAEIPNWRMEFTVESYGEEYYTPLDSTEDLVIPNLYGTLYLYGLETDGDTIVRPRNIDSTVSLTIQRQYGDNIELEVDGVIEVTGDGSATVTLENIPIEEYLYENEEIGVIAVLNTGEGPLEAIGSYTAPEKPVPSYSMDLAINDESSGRYDWEYDEYAQKYVGYPMLTGTITLTGITGANGEITSPEGIDLDSIHMTVAGQETGTLNGDLEGEIESIDGDTATIFMSFVGVESAYAEEEFTFTCVLDYTGGSLTAEATFKMPRYDDLSMDLVITPLLDGFDFAEIGGETMVYPDIEAEMIIRGDSIEKDNEELIYPDLDVGNVRITWYEEDGTTQIGTVTTEGELIFLDNVPVVMVYHVPMSEPLYPGQYLSFKAEIDYNSGASTLESWSSCQLPERPEHDDLDLVLTLTNDSAHMESYLDANNNLRFYPALSATLKLEGAEVDGGTVTYPESINSTVRIDTTRDTDSGTVTSRFDGAVRVEGDEVYIDIPQFTFPYQDGLLEEETLTVTAFVLCDDITLESNSATYTAPKEDEPDDDVELNVVVEETEPGAPVEHYETDTGTLYFPDLMARVYVDGAVLDGGTVTFPVALNSDTVDVLVTVTGSNGRQIDVLTMTADVYTSNNRVVMVINSLPLGNGIYDNENLSVTVMLTSEDFDSPGYREGTGSYSFKAPEEEIEPSFENVPTRVDATVYQELYLSDTNMIQSGTISLGNGVIASPGTGTINSITGVVQRYVDGTAHSTSATTDLEIYEYDDGSRAITGVSYTNLLYDFDSDTDSVYIVITMNYTLGGETNSMDVRIPVELHLLG